METQAASPPRPGFSELVRAGCEDYVLKGLARLTAGRSVLVIAHRLSTLRDADRVYVVEGGRVVDSGRHEELAARPGTYRDMNALLTAS